ncbi:MAG: hypothetical protein JSW71_12030 [Gemmatimonadota bacterium]|nr:MAG: hypothetical protein JSW71_12030 [Gemmatimonadota bacterium]
MRAAITMLLVLKLLTPTAEVWCQLPNALGPGDQVKLYRSGVQRNLWDWHGPDVRGTVLAVTSDSLALLTTAGSTVVVPLSTIGGVAIKRGPRSNWRKGVAAGVVIGAGAGLVAGLIGNLETDGCQTGLLLEPSRDCQDTWVPVLGMMGLGALGGGLLGTAIGSLIKTDSWEEVSLEHRPVRFIADRGHLAVAASVNF